LAGARQQGRYERAASVRNVLLQAEPLDVAAVVDDLIGPKPSQDRVK
jgi:hypothetical protein